MQHAQHLQLQWLQNCLAHQLHQTKMLEKADQFMQAEEQQGNEAEKANAERMKRQNEEKRGREEMKAAEVHGGSFCGLEFLWWSLDWVVVGR